MSFKLRIQILIVLVIFVVSSLLTGYYLYRENHVSIERSKHSSENIKTVFNSIIEDLDRFYTFRAYANLRSAGVKESVIAFDSQKLYDLTIPRYKTLQEENPYLSVMHFHGPDGRSILRMHQKEHYGDMIANRRPMVKKTHLTQTLQTGFEGGVEGIAYRIIIPYMEKGKYLGALEFGVSTDYIIQKLEQTTGIESILLLHESRFAAADAQEYAYRYNGYRFTTISDYQRPIVEDYIRDNTSFEKRVVEHEGKSYEVVPIKIMGTDGNPMGLLLCLRDVTAGQQDTMQTIIGSLILSVVLILILLGIFEYSFEYGMRKIHFQEEYITTILNSQKNIIVVTDGKDIIYVNNAFFDYMHYHSLEDFRKDYKCICNLFEKSETENYLQPLMDEKIWTEYILAHKELEHRAKITVDAKTSIFNVHAQKMDYEGLLRYVVVFTDITKLNELATVDPLTHIANRFQFDKVLSYSQSIARRYKRTFCLLLVDIDFFKHVNDNHGHLVGDEVLKTFSSLINQHIRQSDVVCRWGGEEFMILLPDTDLSSAMKMAESLRQRVEVHLFETVGQITCSIGVAEFDPEKKIDDLLIRVDDNLYRAKESGRNKVVS